MEKGQLNLFDIEPEQKDIVTAQKLNIVKASFEESEKKSWKELFDGYDELYGITFSSGIQFMDKVVDMFEHIELVFGCEEVVSNDLASIMAMQVESVERLAKCKVAKTLAERIEQGNLILSVSRDTKSHEKIYVLKAKDGRTRVITGSANLSASAFCGHQRENIVCFDDKQAFDYYMNNFEDFQEKCSDNVNDKLLLAIMNDQEYLRDNIDELPILKKEIVILEDTIEDNDEIEIIANIKGLEKELKPYLPKTKNDKRIVLDGSIKKAFTRKHIENREITKEKRKKLPKLHIDYDNEKLFFNDKELSLRTDLEKIKNDISCLEKYMSSFSGFHGDWKQAQKDYYAFLNWYFASPFMPYLRDIGVRNNYDITPFPVFGIIYGESNGGKSTFVKFASKLMCGTKVPLNSSNDFTGTTIEDLKRSCEGLPINIDDLAKAQYENHYEKVIKDDTWGIAEHFVNYPSICITTNKVPSLKSDISKRAVTCYIGIRLDKETGAKNSKKINESMHQTTTSLYCEYVSRMFPLIISMAEEMKGKNDEYFPDIFEISSKVLMAIIKEYSDSVPDYVMELTYSDYFGDTAIGKNAMKKILSAWENDRKNFKIDKKKNTLTYTYADSNRTYELRYIQQELPPALNAEIIGSSLVMNLKKANEVFGLEFKKKIWE